MKPLILTLVIVVVATTVGTGWIITQFHSFVYSSDEEINRNILAYKQLGRSIGATLDDFNHRDALISHWRKEEGVQINVQDSSAFIVPNDIDVEFRRGAPLLLESEGEMSMHLYMPKTDEVLSFMQPVQRPNQPAFINVVLTLLFYLVVISVLLVWLYPLIKRLVLLEKTANHLGTGDLSSRVSPSRFSYISSIENEFNRMANQIQKLVNDNQLLSRAVSHNLKTPITRLRMGVDVLEEKVTQPEVDKFFKRINSDLDEMESLVKTLLKYSSLDEFKIRLRIEPVDLCQFILKLVENEDATSVKIMTVFSAKKIVVETDQQYLAMCLSNILSNAVQHARGVVEVRVDQCGLDSNPQDVIISIEDDGLGILESDLENVTKPFWRGVNDHAIKGHGMGLAIVARISEWLNTELIIKKSSTLGGASVSILFRLRVQSALR